MIYIILILSLLPIPIGISLDHERRKMTITKVNEKVINLEKDNQTITITWKEMLYLLDEFIYAAEGTKKKLKARC